MHLGKEELWILLLFTFFIGAGVGFYLRGVFGV